MKISKQSFLFLFLGGFLFYSFPFPALALEEEISPLKNQRIFISENFNHIQNEGINILNALRIPTKIFSLKPQTQSGKSSRYAILLHGIPVYQGYLVVWKESNGFANVLLPDFNFASASELTVSNKVTENGKSFYAFREGKWKRITAHVRAQGNDIKNSDIDYYDENGDFVFTEDWLLKAGPDSVIKGTIFRPDPVSRIRIPYGGNLTDRGDSTSSFLDAALDTVFIKVKFESDTFSLENQWFKLGDFALPVKPLAKRISADYCFKRDNPFFEEFNVYYHLNQFRAYIDSLGFAELANYQLRIDAHGMDGADQSAYSPVQDVLAYGDGNVDDAEDAGVIVHEYCHALAHSAISFGNSGNERRALEEGFCDYLAGSYCKSISDWNWEKLFKWDGHNEFWAGRSLLSSKVYPADLVGQMHRDGEIFSSALSNIELQIGRKKTHQILLNSLPFFIPNMGMRQAARVMFHSDSTLFNGANNVAMTSAFQNRGIHPNQIIVSNDFEYRNPVQNSILVFQIEGKVFLKNNGKESGEAFLLDQNGRVLQKISGLLPGQQVSISNKATPDGLYLIRFIGSKQTDIQRFIKISN